MTALPRLQRQLEERMAARRRTRAPQLAGGFLALAAVAGVAAVGLGGSDAEDEVPAAPPINVMVGKPVVPADPAGDPAEGVIELRSGPAGDPQALEALFFTYKGGPCLEIGSSKTIRQYPVREGGSCHAGALEDMPQATGAGISSGVDAPTVVDGMARPDVEHIEIDGPGGLVRPPLSEHRAWFVAYPATARGDVAVTAVLKGGRRETIRFRVPLDPGPPITEGPGREGDPVPRALQVRRADVDEIELAPSSGDPLTTFELRVPQAGSRDMYAFSIDGPGGKDCQGRLDESGGIEASSHSGRVRPLPPHRQPPFMSIDTPGYDEAARTAPWCRGRYEVKVRYLRFKERGSGRVIARLEFQVG
jgi:hypothetical protein